MTDTGGWFLYAGLVCVYEVGVPRRSKETVLGSSLKSAKTVFVLHHALRKTGTQPDCFSLPAVLEF
jgi:hypothetical protein